MSTEITSLIEGYQRTRNFIIIYDRVWYIKIYSILHGSPGYGNSSIYLYLGFWIRAFVRLVIYIYIFGALVIYHKT